MKTTKPAAPSRRTLLALGLGAGAFTLLPLRAAVAQQGEPASEDFVRALGDPDAPVKVVEYASMTCSHCASFHVETFPQLEEQYIDTGKVYFEFREFPLDPVATAAFMLARCVDEDRYFPFVDALFKTQKGWAFGGNPEEGLYRMAQQAGFTREKFEECLTNQAILNQVNAVKQRGIEEFDVSSTPTFIINGEVVPGALPFEEFEKRVQQHLPS